jgi:Sulfatase
MNMNAPIKLPKDRGLLRVATTSVFLLLAAVMVNAQQTTGVPGSPSATTTIDGKQLPAPDPQFGGVIKDNALQSKPWWAPRIVPAKQAPNILLIMTDDAGFGVPGTYGGVIPTPAMGRIAKAGLKYTQFHSTALCSPRRAYYRAQPSLGRLWRNLGAVHRFPRLQ